MIDGDKGQLRIFTFAQLPAFATTHIANACMNFANYSKQGHAAHTSDRATAMRDTQRTFTCPAVA